MVVSLLVKDVTKRGILLLSSCNQAHLNILIYVFIGNVSYTRAYYELAKSNSWTRAMVCVY